MVKIIPVPYKIILIIAITLAVFSFGFHKGSISQIKKSEANRVALQEELFTLGEKISIKNNKILRLLKEREDLINDLEKEALVAKGSNAPGVATTGGLQRLERRWSSSD